jgi:hypothetical protein
MENLTNVALLAIEELNNLFNDSMKKAKEQIKNLKPEEAEIVNNSLGKIEELIRGIKMPSLESLKNPSDLEKNNNKIILKLGNIQKELENLQKVCRL